MYDANVSIYLLSFELSLWELPPPSTSPMTRHLVAQVGLVLLSAIFRYLADFQFSSWKELIPDP
jgi:hypothetical protein